MNILFSKTLRVTKSLDIFYLTNKLTDQNIFSTIIELFLKATLVKPLFIQFRLQPIFFPFRRNVLSLTKRICLINVKQQR